MLVTNLGGGGMVTNLIEVCTKATEGMSAVPQTVCHHPLQHAHWGGEEFAFVGGGGGDSLKSYAKFTNMLPFGGYLLTRFCKGKEIHLTRISGTVSIVTYMYSDVYKKNN